MLQLSGGRDLEVERETSSQYVCFEACQVRSCLAPL